MLRVEHEPLEVLQNTSCDHDTLSWALWSVADHAVITIPIFKTTLNALA